MAVDVALAIPVRGRRCLVARRPAGTHLGGLWEFPGGKILEGEDPAEAAARELVEETGLSARDLDPLLIVTHDYAERAVRLHCFVAREPGGEPSRNRAWRWMSVEELSELEMPEANRSVVRALSDRLAREA